MTSSEETIAPALLGGADEPDTDRPPPRDGTGRPRLAAAARKLALLAIAAVAWELYARHLGRPLMLPTASATATALAGAVARGELLARVGVSLRLLLAGYAAGALLAAALAVAATATRTGADLLELLTAMMNPLPAIALLPVALMWFGIGTPSLLFVLVHAVLWPMALAAHAGLASVSPTLRMVGRNLGLRGAALAVRVLAPAAFPQILSGLKMGWAFGWRTLIAAELVFGVGSGSGGLGWFIYEKKNELETAQVFAGLATVVLIGLAVEHGVFRVVEERTIGRWGMRA
jgi:NitT/TauT family transport system permease protein